MKPADVELKSVLDACVLYPTVMREILLGATAAGLVQPLWSDKILEEWARAARKRDPDQEAVARGEIAVLRGRWLVERLPRNERGYV